MRLGGEKRVARIVMGLGNHISNHALTQMQIQTGTATPGEGREGEAPRVPGEVVATAAVVDNHESSESIVRK